MQNLILNLIFGLVLLGTVSAIIALAIDAFNATK
jgi:hypothetical protein